jgi:hypothetical protein
MPMIRHAILCLFLVGCASGSSQMTASAAPAPPPEPLGECLARKGAHLYGASWCHWCHVQLELFGPQAAKVPYTDCDASGSLDWLPACAEKGLEFDSPLPAWIFADGTRINGVRSLKWLAYQTNCPVP